MSYKMIFEFGRALIAFTPGGFCDYTEEVPTNGLHSHHTFELAFVMSGTGIFFHGNDKYSIKKNDLILSCADVPHEIQAAPDKKAGKKSILSLYYMNFDIQTPVDWVPDTFEERILWNFKEKHGVWADNQSHLICYMELISNYQKKVTKNTLGIRYNLLGFLLESLSVLSQFVYLQPVTASYNHIVDDAISYIAVHYTEKISMDILAESCNTSVRNLQHVFKKHMGCTITAYINQVRMNQAGCYLRMNYKVSEAGEKAGIPDSTRFSKLFKKYYGVSPLEYQKDRYVLSSYLTELK